MTFGQQETCSVTTFFRDLTSKAEVSSSRYRISKFSMEMLDGEFTKLIVHDGSGVKISVGGQIVKSIFKKDPVRLRLKLSFSGESDDTYDSLDGVEAETIYDKRWQWLSIGNEIRVKDRIHTFTLGCERVARKYRS